MSSKSNLRELVALALIATLAACAPKSPAVASASVAIDSLVTVPTRFVEAHGTRYAYRRYGAPSTVPLVLLQHFRGSMDNWDPALVDDLARDRTVIVFDNKGVSGSSGTTPDSFAAMADDAADFIAALGYPQVDVLGFSIGGAVAQALAINHPAVVRKLILAGTAPPGGEGMNARDPKIIAIVTRAQPVLDDFLTVFFEPTPTSQQLGRAFLDRRTRRTRDVDPPSSAQTLHAQIKARQDWGATVDPDHAQPARITQPTLVANGSHDIMMFTPNSVTLYQKIPNAQLILYPDSGHGFLFQYPHLFAAHVALFLRADGAGRP